MIDLYTWGTPNGRKASIMLEECGLAYDTHPINIAKNEQFAPDFLKISPNNKIPAIIDHETGQSVFETGAILIYLAEKTGKFLPADPVGRSLTFQWLMWQMGGLGPMLGQANHFIRFAPEKVPYAIKRYHEEAKRLYGVADKRLAEATYLAGEDYTIADIAAWPWINIHDFHDIDLAEFPNVVRWHALIGARPAVQRGMKVP
jgi:GSH-dependent disulfide-bond oxidoreductase